MEESAADPTAQPQRDPPLLSVIMPAYNCAGVIRESLTSVFSQGYDRIEVVIVDDGSRDDTAKIAREFDPRVRVFAQQNLGPAAARNLAITKAAGTYLAFLDADDVWLPGKLGAQMEFLATHPAAKIVFARHIFWFPDDRGDFLPASSMPWKAEDGLCDKLSGWIYPELLLDSQIHIITAVIHRSVYDAVGEFDGTFGKGSDYDFWLRASRQFEAFQLARDGALYRIHPAGISARRDRVCAQYEIVNRALGRYGYTGPDGRAGDVMRIRERLAEVCFTHAYAHFWHGDPDVSSNYFKLALKHGGWKFKTAMYMLFSDIRRLKYVFGRPVA